MGEARRSEQPAPSYKGGEELGSTEEGLGERSQMEEEKPNANENDDGVGKKSRTRRPELGPKRCVSM